ncbi:putative UDP-Gal or UDP-GlcNAc-dependent glycosyltransferase [Trypanosoma cruzi]|nr:putative UDP-Gal or UDP-GlcNAc-dependent glycosyltransferase [Trypanosoma cruzi]
MAKPKLLTLRQKLKRVTVLLIPFIVATTVLTLRLDTAADDGAPEPNNPRHSRAPAADDAALAHIPRSVVDTWSGGVPCCAGHPLHGRRREANTTQPAADDVRRFPGVATRANDFTGAMLVLYVLGRHPSHGYDYSAALLEEAAQWQDVVALPMNEGRVTRNKAIGCYGTWGEEADAGMSRKTYMWFDLAHRLFSTARYITKGDDDMFLRVPLFVAHLRLLPRRGVYMGVHMSSGPDLKRGLPGYSFMVGWCYTLSRDVAEALVSFKPLRRLAYLPYSEDRYDEFALLQFYHEDNMVGYVLEKAVNYKPLVYVKVLPCHFHDARNSTGHSQVVPTSMCVHHVREDDYAALMARFGKDTSPVAHLWQYSEDVIYPWCD